MPSFLRKFLDHNVEPEKDGIFANQFIVQLFLIHLGSRMNFYVLQIANNWGFPTFGLCPLDSQHVICEMLAKT